MVKVLIIRMEDLMNMNLYLNDNLNIKMNKNIGYENKYKSIEFTLHNFKNNKKVLFNENEVKLNNNKFKVNL